MSLNQFCALFPNSQFDGTGAKAQNGTLIQTSMNQKTYELTRQVFAEEVDTDERLTGAEMKFNPGARFTVIREPHAWGIAQTVHFTIQVNGKTYNVLGPVLNASMREVRP